MHFSIRGKTRGPITIRVSNNDSRAASWQLPFSFCIVIIINSWGIFSAYRSLILRNNYGQNFCSLLSKFVMSQTTFFVKECPTCGRNLQVRIEYLGREMMCNHCGGDFVADDTLHGLPDNPAETIIARIDELLANSETPGKPR
jgi:predicted RNA-binding Zn-ribbon protein involved in translation (DUF1610 family)